MDEFTIIRRYFVRDPGDAAVSTGIGDDGAVLCPDHDRQLVTVIDTLVSGIHFPAALAAADVGYRSVAVNLSDMAAMGARPRWMKLALTLTEASESWLAGFSDGLFAAADEHNVSLIGGDTTRGQQLVVTIEVLGDVIPGHSMLRSGALPGDDIFVTGYAGDAAAGLNLIQSGSTSGADANYLIHRFCRPSARVAFGQAIAGSVHAAIDTSDGLLGDLGKMLDASGVGATIDLESIPLSAELGRQFPQGEAMQFALAGGDDYEICFTGDEVTSGNGLPTGVPVTRIGVVEQNPGLRCTRNGLAVDYDATGYRHFVQGAPDDVN